MKEIVSLILKHGGLLIIKDETQPTDYILSLLQKDLQCSDQSNL